MFRTDVCGQICSISKLYSDINVLTKDAYEYKFGFNGMQPYSFAFYSNHRGFLLDEVSQDANLNTVHKVRPLLHSFFSYNENNSVSSAPERKEGKYDKNTGEELVSQIKFNINKETGSVDGVDYRNKLFINAPENGNPVISAYTTNTTNTINITADAGSLTGSTLQFIGGGLGAEVKDEVSDTDGNIYQNVSYGTVGYGGAFKLIIPEKAAAEYAEQSIRIRLDFSAYELNADGTPVLDENKMWKKRTDENKTEAEKDNYFEMIETVKAGQTEYDYQWTGKDNHGNTVPAGLYTVDKVKIFLESASAHFPLLDVERAASGIKLERLTNSEDTTRYNVYYNNDGSPENTQKGWYYTGQFKGRTFTDASSVKKYTYEIAKDYPSKMADGQNGVNGISTEETGAVPFNTYAGDDLKFINPSRTEGFADGAELSGYSITDSNGASYTTTGAVKGSEAAYGNFCAIDIWSSKLTDVAVASIPFGLQEYVVEASEPILSFVAKNGKVENVPEGTPFDQSHVKRGTGTITYPTNRGNAIYGNTISTGFITTLNVGEGQTGSSVAWKVSVPKDTEVYVKTGSSGTLDATNGWSQLIGNDGEVFDDDGATKNPGRIYKTNGTGFDLKFRYDLGVTVSEGTQVVFGIVLDNIYAPESEGTVTWYEEDNHTGYDVLVFDNAENGQIPAIRSKTITEFENHEYNPYGENYTAMTAASDYSVLFGTDFMVDMWDVEDEMSDRIDDILSDSTETNDNDIGMDFSGSDEVEAVND